MMSVRYVMMSGGKGTRAINIGRLKTCTVRTKLNNWGRKRCQNHNGRQQFPNGCAKLITDGTQEVNKCRKRWYRMKTPVLYNKGPVQYCVAGYDDECKDLFLDIINYRQYPLILYWKAAFNLPGVCNTSIAVSEQNGEPNDCKCIDMPVSFAGSIDCCHAAANQIIRYWFESSKPKHPLQVDEISSIAMAAAASRGRRVVAETRTFPSNVLDPTTCCRYVIFEGFLVQRSDDGPSRRCRCPGDCFRRRATTAWNLDSTSNDLRHILRSV
jgi:hypothetical protein